MNNDNKTTIRKLTYMLIEMSEGGTQTDDAKLNYRVAREHIRNAVARSLKEKLFEDRNAQRQDDSDEEYLGNDVSKEVEVKYDSEGSYLYVDMLGESVDFGGSMKSYSLYFKNTHNTWGCLFVPLNRKQISIYKNLPQVPNTIPYYKEGDRIIIVGGLSEGDKLMLNQKNVIPNDDDDALPTEIGSKALRMAWESVYPEVQMPMDRNNDGIPNN